jgi:hypothetical protein
MLTRAPSSFTIQILLGLLPVYIQIQHGKESFKETIEIFSNSQLVVGFHGVLFYPRETVVCWRTPRFMTYKQENMKIK